MCADRSADLHCIARRSRGEESEHEHDRLLPMGSARHAGLRSPLRPTTALPVAIVMLVGWFINMNILAPLVRSGLLQVHPIVVTFAFLLGAQLAGPIGAIVAIPAAAVV